MLHDQIVAWSAGGAALLASRARRASVSRACWRTALGGCFCSRPRASRPPPDSAPWARIISCPLRALIIASRSRIMFHPRVSWTGAGQARLPFRVRPPLRPARPPGRSVTLRCSHMRLRHSEPPILLRHYCPRSAMAALMGRQPARPGVLVVAVSIRAPERRLAPRRRRRHSPAKRRRKRRRRYTPLASGADT